PGARLHLIGLEDRLEETVSEALSGLIAGVPAGEPAVVLVHRPDAFAAVAATGAPLVLAGHTHGGQLAVPGMRQLNLAWLLRMSFHAGSFVRDGSLLHVNRGLGASGQCVRVAAPRE